VLPACAAPPALTPLARGLQKSHPAVPKVCVVTGGTGFVGLRLVEMLVERGAQKVCLRARVRARGAGRRAPAAARV